MIEDIAVHISIGTEELARDLERIEDEELELPTVSSVAIKVNGKTEEAVVWLEGK